MSKFQIDFEGYVEVDVPGNGEANMEMMGQRVKEIVARALTDYYVQVPQVEAAESEVYVTNQISKIGNWA